MLKEIIYNHFIEKTKEYEMNKEVTFSPSSFYECKRKLYYKATGHSISNPIDEAAKVKMELGSSCHKTIQNILVNQGIWKEGEELKEIEYNNVKFRYRIDGLCEIDGNKYLLELKTVYAAGFNSIEKEPKPDHLMQTVIYMIFEGLNNAILLYLGRDSGRMIEYHIKRDNQDVYIGQNLMEKKENYIKQIDKIVDDLLILKAKIEIGLEPERDHSMVIKNNNGKLSFDFDKDKVHYKTEWNCSYCLWSDHCWKDVIEEMKNHKFYINNKFID